MSPQAVPFSTDSRISVRERRRLLEGVIRNEIRILEASYEIGFLDCEKPVGCLRNCLTHYLERRVEEPELSPSVTTTPSNSSLCLYLVEMNGGRDRTRTCDLLRVKQAL